MFNKIRNVRPFINCSLVIFIWLLSGCSTLNASHSPLDTLQLIDDYPLYTMRYEGDYKSALNPSLPSYNEPPLITQLPIAHESLSWGCSLFATLADGQNLLYGRNFDWDFSPALLLFLEPTQGYASVSMVDMAYLGFTGNRAKEILDLSFQEKQRLLEAPWLPFDGMNEAGLVIGMASVPSGNMPSDPQKPTIDSLVVIREMLDQAATVDEAVSILGKYNIDMGNVHLHYLIADRSRKAALVEFYRGEMRILENEEPWHIATNFIVASVGGNTKGHCDRYDIIASVLEDNQGEISSSQAISLLNAVSLQGKYNTQWSIVYGISTGEIRVVMGREYQNVYKFKLQGSYNANTID